MGRSRGDESLDSFTNQFHWLHQVQGMDREVVGDRAFYLNQLAQHHHPVMDGFVIPASKFRNFLSNIHWPQPPLGDLSTVPLYVKVDDPYQIQTIARQIRQSIRSAPLEPELVEAIVLATQPWQTPFALLHPSLVLPKDRAIDVNLDGLMESQLCRLEANAIATALKQLWAEIFRARSLVYWHHHGVELQRLQLATIVQPLSVPWASGYLSLDESHTIAIQAFRGLGTLSLLQGELVADNYELDSETGVMQTCQIGKKLIAYQLAELPSQNSPASTHLIEAFQAIANDRHPGLQAYLLPEQEQQQPVLTSEQLQALLHLAQQAQPILGETLKLEWAIANPLSSAAVFPVYITQALAPALPQKQPPPIALPSVSSLPLIAGLAAASGRATAHAYIVSRMDQKPEALAPNTILVAPMIQPDWLPVLRQVVGIVTEQGGFTSHAAIIARELGIPAIVGATHATRLLKMGQLLVVDGDRGEVYQAEASASEELTTRLPEHQSESSANLPVASFPHTHTKTTLLVNLSQTSSLPVAKNLAVDGIGLLRSELMMLEALNAQHPADWIKNHSPSVFVECIANHIQQFAQAFAPRPIWYRSLDLRPHEFSHSALEPSSSTELNPMLGQRGTLSYLLNPDLFDLELAALCQVYQQGYTNVHLLLPFVRTVEEFIFCRQRLQKTPLGQYPQFQLWIMAEVPSVLFLLPEYVQAGVQGISIGTNDLTQLLLAIDRDQGNLANQFTPKHPVVMRAIAQLIRQAKQLGIPCSICGQAPIQYPDLIESLIGWGITSISVEAHAVGQTYEAIVRAEQQLVMGAMG